ncbi:hypothetical protein IFM89_039278 [Coptis chinensis]|uniref:Uncharacterized protein n=1 Tax=Coptis chinensis TaxID=261450 RepID=A0A835I8Z9_9MAGN|nr:hypothetical protein IFM89_039278 [Coptis chinensis]
MVFTLIDWNTECVPVVGMTSETTKTTSSFTIPLDLTRLKVFKMLSSMSSDNSTRKGLTPHCKFRVFLVQLLSVNAKMGGFGRLHDRNGVGKEERKHKEEEFGFSSDGGGDVTSSSLSFEFSSSSDDQWATSSSSSSSDLPWESDLIQMPVGANGLGGGGKIKQKKIVDSAGSVASVLDKGYVRDSLSNGLGQNMQDVKSNVNVNNEEEAEQFLCSMLGDDCDLSMAVVRDVLCQCGYDVDTALDVLDLSSSASSSHNQLNDGYYGDYSQISEDSRTFTDCVDSGEDSLAKSQFPDRMSDSTDSSRGYLDVLVRPKRQCMSSQTSKPQELF